MAFPSPAEATTRPSGLDERAAILAGSPLPSGKADVKVWRTRPLEVSQSLTLRSAPPDARMSPSGLNATDVTAAEWPRSVRSSRPELRSQSLIVPAISLDARVRPLELKATARTRSECPVSRTSSGFCAKQV